MKCLNSNCVVISNCTFFMCLSSREDVTLVMVVFSLMILWTNIYWVPLGIVHLQWTIFCQNSSLWPICLRWPCRAWFIASLSYASPFTTTKLWSTEGKWKQWHILFSWGSKIILNSDCSHEIKSCLLLGRKAMTNLDTISKSRDITLPTKVCLVKAMVFPIVTFGCESWTKEEELRLSTKELMLLNCSAGEDSWESLGLQGGRSNQSILKEINHVYSL